MGHVTDHVMEFVVHCAAGKWKYGSIHLIIIYLYSNLLLYLFSIVLFMLFTVNVPFTSLPNFFVTDMFLYPI